MTDARVRRGRRSEEVAANYLRPVFPEADTPPASTRGRDIRHVEPFAPEVKARKGFEPLRAMQQAERNAGEDIPMVVLRMDGQGETDPGEWLAMFRFRDARELMEVYKNRLGIRDDRGTAEQSSPEERAKGFGHFFEIRLGPDANYPSHATLETVMHSLLYAMGFEHGLYEVAVRYVSGSDRAA